MKFLNSCRYLKLDNGLLLILCVLISKVPLTLNQGMYEVEYGGVLRQVRPAKRTDPDVQKVVEYAVRFAKKKLVRSVPMVADNSPDWSKLHVKDIRKVVLVYAPHDVEPLYYETEHQDRYGNVYGMTSFIKLGTTYSFILFWKTALSSLLHNFTITVYPENPFTCNVYSHTFYVQQTNSSETSHNSIFSNEQYYGYSTGSKVSEDIFFSKMDQSDSLNHRSDQLNSLYSDIHGEYSHHSQSASNKCQGDMSECELELEDDLHEKPSLKYTLFENMKLKIMSYNIWNMDSLTKRNSDYVKRMESVQKVLQVSPDIIGFQEIRYGHSSGGKMGPCQVCTLQDMLPRYQFVFQPAQMQPNTLQDGRTEEGVAIFSKYPILSHNYILLFLNRSNSADQHQRVCLHAEIAIPHIGKVHVFVTHLSLSHEAREQSVVQIWQYMKQVQGPAILLGDLNAEPDERAVQYLRGKRVFDDQTEQSELIDLWLEYNKGSSEGYTYNALEPDLRKRIDFIFLKQTETCCELLDCLVLDDGNRGSKAASDHLPIQATLQFKHRRKHTR